MARNTRDISEMAHHTTARGDLPLTDLRAILKWLERMFPPHKVECLYDEWKRAAKRMGTDGVK